MFLGWETPTQIHRDKCKRYTERILENFGLQRTSLCCSTPHFPIHASQWVWCDAMSLHYDQTSPFWSHLSKEPWYINLKLFQLRRPSTLPSKPYLCEVFLSFIGITFSILQHEACYMPVTLNRNKWLWIMMNGWMIETFRDCDVALGFLQFLWSLYSLTLDCIYWDIHNLSHCWRDSCLKIPL